MSPPTTKRRPRVVVDHFAKLSEVVVRLTNTPKSLLIEEARLAPVASSRSHGFIDFGKKFPLGTYPTVILGEGETTLKFDRVRCVTTRKGEFDCLVLSGLVIRYHPSVLIQLSGRSDWVKPEVIQIDIKELIIPSIEGNIAWAHLFLDIAAALMLRLEFKFPLLAPTAD